MSPVIRKTLLSAVILAGAGVIVAGQMKHPFIMDANAAEGSNAEVVATVNGTAITTRDLNVYARGRGQNTPPKQALINELVERELLYQQALAKGVDKNPDLLVELENQRHVMIANRFISEMVAAKTPTDEEMRKFYQQRVANQSEAEYKTSHILVEAESLAKDVIANLNKGKKFNELAKQHSMDAMAQQGGDLGWLGTHQMPEPYAKAVQGLEKGKYTTSPVKSDFGWHVIRLEDKRTPQPPAYEDVKDQIKGALQGQMINDYIATLKAKATIQIK